VDGNESIFNVLFYILRNIRCKVSPYLSKRFVVSRDFCSSRGLCFFPVSEQRLSGPSCATQPT